MSGLNIERSKLAAFTLAGLFAGIGGLYLAFQTSSGNADVPQAGAYTLNSIAAVVIGGTSLMGGSGGAVGSFLGVVAAGMMLVILMGHIDLSVPWTLAAGAMMATAVGGPLAIPVGLAVGLAVGLVNGLGVAYLRVPSMIFTLGVNAVMRGLMVAHTGGFAPQTEATPLLEFLAVNRVATSPMPLVVWAVLSLTIVLLLQRTPPGRYSY